jgi:hypothetical protein
MEKKILHYYPSSVSIFDQAQSVGLVQGISGFTTQFCPSETCQSLTTKKHKLSFFSPEPDFSLVIMVEVPHAKAEGNSDKVVWFERELEPQLLQSAVRHTYDAFHVLYGTLASQMKLLGPDGLRALLAQFMTIYLPVLNMGRQDIFSVLDGISFMPMERTSWLQAQCLINEAEQTFPELKKCALFFKDNLIASSLDVGTLRPLCRYLFHYPPHKAQARQEGHPNGGLLGLSHRNNVVYAGGEQYFMLVFKMSDLMVVLLLNKLANVDEMTRFFKTGVLQFIPEMQRSLLSFEHAENSFRFVYYNGVNWALKVGMGGSRKPVSRDAIHVISSIHASMKTGANEVVARHGNSFVLGKRVDHRELFVLFEGTNDTLLDVETKMHTLQNSLLGNIYF